MDHEYSERRKHIRIYFNNLKETNGEVVTTGDTVRSLFVPVLDLSLGGIHFTVNEPQSFAFGDRLILTRLEHSSGLLVNEAVTMEIRWVFVHPEYQRAYIGCMFVDLPDASRKQFAALIDLKLRQAVQEKGTVSEG